MDITKQRSPSYPSMTLEEAIGKVRTVWTHAKKTDVNIESVAKYWGYGLKSSGWRIGIAALKRFGLLDAVGNKKSGQVKVSDLAQRILLDVREESPEREAAIKTAALKPPIYAALWSHWDGELPDDDVVRTYLTMNKEFNEGAVDGFIKDFRKTILFAKLVKTDRIGAAGVETANDEDDDDANKGDDERQRPSRGRKRMEGSKEAVLPLDAGDMVIMWPNRISAEEIPDVEGWMEIVLRKLKRDAAEPQDSPEDLQ